MDLSDILVWSETAFPVPVEAGTSLVVPAGETGLPRAAANILRATAPEEGTPDKRALSLAQGLNAVATQLKANGRDAQAVTTFRAAAAALNCCVPGEQWREHYDKARRFAEGNLRRLGAPQELDSSLPLPDVVEPWLDLSEAVKPFLRTFTGTRRPRPDLTSKGLIEDLAGSWGDERVDLVRTSRALEAYLTRILRPSEVLSRELGDLIRGDLAGAAEVMSGGKLPTDRASLQTLTREFRRSAFEAPDEVERRIRWIIACLGNFMLWTVDHGLTTNEPQVHIDLMGYVGAVLKDNRYNDADRDLLLDCAESQVRVGSRMAPVVLGRFDYIREWLLTAIGTYLLLAGPDPSTPSDSYYDERIQSSTAVPRRGLQRAPREHWARILLEQWRGHGEKVVGACFAIAAAAGWDSARTSWLIAQIFDPSDNGRPAQDSAFWTWQTEHLLRKVARVRVTANPWAALGATDARDSMITSDAKGRLAIPTAVLKAAVAQGLEADEVVTVHGQLFAGRRVPTYLLTNRFGPYAILKIDHSEKVLREVRSFERYARRLHQSHRPSECHAHPMDMHLGEDGAPLRAIQTAYVFEEQDRPLTFSAWLREADVEAARGAVQRLLLGSMRPWLAHIRRERVDLRSEYPVFRPGPSLEKQSPSNWFGTEKAKLDVAVRELGLPISLDEGRSADGWAEQLPLLSEVAVDALPADGLVNPVWLAAEIAEAAGGDLSWLVDSMDIGLRDYETLIALSHGDLHLDNVLCTAADHGTPRTVLIDFESAHYGHVCKDPARLEASLLCQVFEWHPNQARELIHWFSRSSLIRGCHAELQGGPSISTKDALGVATAIVSDLRELTSGCGQKHWPLTPEEYTFSLVGALLPMVRYGTLSFGQRRLALALATVAGTSLLTRWEHQR